MKPLREPAFARLWIAAFFSETAEWMLQIALPVFVWNRRLVLCVVCAGQAFVALPLLFAASGGPVVVLYAVMAGQAGLASLFEPARNALVPELVGPDELTGANGLMSINGSVARLAGGWAGGLLLGFGGLGWVVVAYLGVLVIASALLARPFRRVAAPLAAGPHEPVLRAWLDGLREIGREARLRVAGVVVVLTSLAQGMLLVLFVVFVLDILSGTEGDVGLLRGVQALGGLVAGFAVATVARKAAPARAVRPRAQHDVRRDGGLHRPGRAAGRRAGERAGHRRPAERPGGPAHRLRADRAGRPGVGTFTP
jgi:MFS family permease